TSAQTSYTSYTGPPDTVSGSENDARGSDAVLEYHRFRGERHTDGGFRHENCHDSQRRFPFHIHTLSNVLPACAVNCQRHSGSYSHSCILYRGTLDCCRWHIHFSRNIKRVERRVGYRYLYHSHRALPEFYCRFMEPRGEADGKHLGK